MATPKLLSSASRVPLQLQPGETIILRRNGIAERKSVFLSFGDPGYPFIPLYTPYPGAATGGFVCDSYEKEQLPGGWWKSTVVWISLYVGPTSYITYESKVIQVPIDQSPQFTTIAGTPLSPINGAVFDANGQFVGFGPGDFQGVVSAFISQNLQVVHGSGFFPGVPDTSLFVESISNTLRGGVWEYEISYNLDIALNGVVVNNT